MNFPRFHRIGPFWLPSTWLRDDWLTSYLTAKLFFLSALCVLALTPALMRMDTTKIAFWIRLPLTPLGSPLPTGGPFLFFGMWGFWVRLENPSGWAKRVWFSFY